MVDRVEDLDVWQDRLGIFMLTRVAGTFFLNSHIGDAGNNSLVDAGTLVIYFGTAASWRPCNVVWPHQGPVSLS